MTEEVRDKLFDLIDTINNNKKVLRMKKLKKSIYNDKSISEDLSSFKKIMDNPYDNEYIYKKSKILDNKMIKEYKELENELFFIVQSINKDLKSLIDRKKCSNESN